MSEHSAPILEMSCLAGVAKPSALRKIKCVLIEETLAKTIMASAVLGCNPLEALYAGVKGGSGGA